MYTSVSVSGTQGRTHDGTHDDARSSARSSERSPYLGIARRYVLAAMGCALFAFIYAQFSHGVYSPFMTFMFAIPLAGGALAAGACHLAKVHKPPRLTRQAWALAIASLTLGSCLQGIFEIAGTSSALVVAYPLAALAFAVTGVVALVRRRPPR